MSELIIPLKLDAYTIKICSAEVTMEGRATLTS